MSTTAVARALGRDVGERGRALADIEEDQWFDRKSCRTSPRDLGEVLVGLANAEGGLVVLGIWNGTIEGVDSAAERHNGWRQAAIDFTIPPVRVRPRLVDCVNDEGRPDHLMVIEVDPSDHVHTTAKDDVFLRVGDETRKLSFVQRQELLYDKGQTNFERTVVRDVVFEELDDDLLGEYAAAVDHGDPGRLLVARGLMTARRELTVGAVLLFGLEPQAHFPEAHLRVVRYAGIERGSGGRQQLVRDVRIDGPLPAQLVRAHDLVAELMPTRRALGSTGRFERIGLVPRDAWLEGIVNAVVHRSYSMQGDHIRVELFDDRVEIESPGRFPGLVSIDDPRAITRFARNPRIARVCSDLRFGQELGEGIRRMFEEMRLAGLADPEYHQSSGNVHLVLRSAPFDRSLDERLPSHARSLMRILRAAGQMSTGDIVEASGLSRPLVLKTMRALASEGLVKWVGNSPKDPRARWSISLE